MFKLNESGGKKFPPPIETMRPEPSRYLTPWRPHAITYISPNATQEQGGGKLQFKQQREMMK